MWERERMPLEARSLRRHDRIQNICQVVTFFITVFLRDAREDDEDAEIDVLGQER